ncbi:MAG: peptidoglycan-binding domain-containing protein [Candidatus Omnitrophota bacterium]
MLKKKIILCVLIPVFLSGCATGRGSVKQQEVGVLQAKVMKLEQEIYRKDMIIKDLEDDLDKKISIVNSEVSKVSKKSAYHGTSTHKKTLENIQRALKKAGYYKGPIDSKIGPNTKSAIVAFQKANSLTPDGVVGKKTWSKLSKFLD